MVTPAVDGIGSLLIADFFPNESKQALAVKHEESR